jgi:hypothetical protein
VASPGRRGWTALAFAVAAAVACWSPLAAPFGLLTGLGAAVLAIRARRDGARVAAAALALGLLASGTAAWVLARTAGLGRLERLAAPASAPAERAVGPRLDEAAERSRAARERAGQEASPGEPPRPSN